MTEIKILYNKSPFQFLGCFILSSFWLNFNLHIIFTELCNILLLTSQLCMLLFHGHVFSLQWEITLLNFISIYSYLLVFFTSTLVRSRHTCCVFRFMREISWIEWFIDQYGHAFLWKFCLYPFLQVHYSLFYPLFQLYLSFSLVFNALICSRMLDFFFGIILFVVSISSCIEIFYFHNLKQYRRLLFFKWR